jgi:hypothetical protein
MLLNFKRVLAALNLSYFGMCGYTFVTAKVLTHAGMLYSCTAGCSVFYLALNLFYKRCLKHLVSRIEWDVDSEQLVVYRANKGFYFKEEAKLIPIE